MLMAYASIAAFFVAAAAFMLGALVLGKLIRPNHPYASKTDTYECGEVPVGPAWFNFNPRFYVIALVYIVFDVEIAFVYPIASVFRRWVDQGMGMYAFVELFGFVAVLIVGLAYVWKKGDLEWVRSVRGTVDGASTSLASTVKAGRPPVPIGAAVQAAAMAAGGPTTEGSAS